MRVHSNHGEAWRQTKRGDTKMTRAEIEQRVSDRGVQLVAEWNADHNDVWHARNTPGFPECKVGDQMVELIGFDVLSVPWIENWEV